MNWISALDTHVLLWMVSIRSDSLTSLMKFATIFGEWQYIVPLTLLFAGLWYFKDKRLSDSIGLLAAVFGAGAAAFVVKELVARARPAETYRLVAESGYSFPSAHATLSAAFFGFAIWHVGSMRHPSTARFNRALTVIVCLAVGFSRLYLGVHYFSDVIGGYAIGALFAWIGTLLCRRFSRAAS